MAAAQRLGVTLQSLEADSPRALRPVLKRMKSAHCAGLLVLGERRGFDQDMATIIFSASENGLPVMCSQPRWAEIKLLGQAGPTCTVALGPNIAHLMERMAVQADKILQGTPPAEIPVEQPTRFELVINLATAKGLGIEVPPSLLMQADKIIQ